MDANCQCAQGCKCGPQVPVAQRCGCGPYCVCDPTTCPGVQSQEGVASCTCACGNKGSTCSCGADCKCADKSCCQFTT